MKGLLKEHPVRKNGKARLVTSGATYFSLLEEILDSAESYIHLQYYIFDLDETGLNIYHALIRAAKRGVKVACVVDGYASGQWTNFYRKSFEDAGILFRRFAPVHFRRLKVGRRMHHKIVVADGKVALIGGVNIANKYNQVDTMVPWLDFAVVLYGSSVQDVERVCIKTWPRRLLQPYLENRKPVSKPGESGQMAIRILQNNWFLQRIEISRSYKNAFRKAGKEMIIVASYFFPGLTMRRLMKRATARGVHITLITGSYSDVALFKPASKFLYDWLLRHGIEIYEWQPSVMHGKLAVVDGNWTTVGSYNLNALSDYGSLELNGGIYDATFAETVREKVMQLKQEGCKPIREQEFHRKTTYLLQFYRWMAYQLIRFGLRFLFVLMRRS